MAKLTEAEIFDCLETNFRLAAEHCEDLAKLPRKGPTYKKLCDELKLIEGACRQAAVWREDSRWLRLGLMMEEAHKRAGDWLRGIAQPGGGRIPIAEGVRHPLFMKLAENLRAGLIRAQETRHNATHTRGIILPPTLPGPHRDTVPVGWTAALNGANHNGSGLIIPAGH